MIPEPPPGCSENDVRFRATYRPEWDGIGVWITAPDHLDLGKCWVYGLALPGGTSGWHRVDVGTTTPASLTLSLGQALQLTESLWNCDVRPPAALESAEHRSTLQAHLADMRRLVELYAKVKLP